MRRLALLVVLLIVAGPVLAGPGKPGFGHPKKGPCPHSKKVPGRLVTVLHVSDTHSHLDGFGPKVGPHQNWLGGIARVATVIKRERAAAPRSLFVHSGDVFQGDLMFNRYFGVPEFQILNSLGLDAMAVGNHEFDLGPDVLAGALSEATKPTLFPLLSANLDLTGYPVLSNWIKPAIIKNVGGVRVGLFGLTVPDDVMNMPDPVVILPDVGTIAYITAAQLRAAGAQVVICLSHLGLLYDKEIAGGVPGIDFILGGHSHDTLRRPLAITNPTGGQTLVMHVGSHYVNVGRLRFQVQAGKVSFFDYRLLPVDGRVRPDRTVGHLVESLKAGVVSAYGDVYESVVGRAPRTLPRVNPPKLAQRDSPVGNLVTDSYRWVTGTEIAIAADGLIAEGIHRGPIVGADVFRVVSYGYDVDSGLGFSLVTMDIKGAELVKGLEFGLAYLGLNEDFFLQVSGIRFSYDPQEDPGSRVDLTTMTVAGDPLDPDRTYSLTVNLGIAYLLPMIGVAVENLNFLPDLEYEVLRDYISGLGTVTYRPEGRIIQK